MSNKLTIELIRKRANNAKLDSINTLNLWGSNLEDISLLSQLPNLEAISLSMNNIKDLTVFKYLKNLRELYLRDNNISDFKQLEHLKNCRGLQILFLKDNPISKGSNYRQKVLEILPFLNKLDDIENNSNPPPACSLIPPPSLIIKKSKSPHQKNNENVFHISSSPPNKIRGNSGNSGINRTVRNNSSDGNTNNNSYIHKNISKVSTNRNININNTDINISGNIIISNNNNQRKIDNNNNNKQIVNSNNSESNTYFNKNNIPYNNLNRSKKFIGAFRGLKEIRKNKLNINSNLDYSVDYIRDSATMGDRNTLYESSFNNTLYGREFTSHNNDSGSGRVKSKYNKKIIGNFKKDQIKLSQSSNIKTKDFDEKKNNEKEKQNSNENNKIVNNIKETSDQGKISTNEFFVIQSVKILLNILTFDELNIIYKEVHKLIEK